MKAHCSVHKKVFYIRYDLGADDVWCESYGLKELPPEYHGEEGSGSSSLDISNSRVGPMYKCPWCGNRSWWRHGSNSSCQAISCYDGEAKNVVCGACGTRCTLGGGHVVSITGSKGSGQ